jgi:glycosyltransferase involved in cell wall biosynthesis
MPPAPLISCIMPTYGRPELVAEAVAMFLAQDYPAKELIVLNDCNGQTFHGSIPCVNVINQQHRYLSLGEKRNAAIEMAQGEILAVWDDDDVHLPWRLSFSLAEMRKWNTEFYRPAEFLAYWGELELHDNQALDSWVSHGPSMFSRSLWRRVGGYPPQGVGEDAEFFRRIHKDLQKEFIKYPLDPENRFYILRGKSLYQHMSMGGGEKPLDTGPASIAIVPIPIRDPILRQACETAIAHHYNLRPDTSNTAEQDIIAMQPILSVCVSVKNRSKVVHRGKELLLFPNCIASLVEASVNLSDLGKIEVVIADFTSDDWPLSYWIPGDSDFLQIRTINVEGDFSRGAGLNVAARNALGGNLLLCDADVMVSAYFLRYCIQTTDGTTALFPIMRLLNEDDSESGWQHLSYGIACLHRDVFAASGGFPEFKSWGGEDDIFFERVSRHAVVRRDAMPGLVHQWHPEHCRHEHYVNPRKCDYENFTKTEDSFKPDASTRIFWGEHPDWQGALHLLGDGSLLRPGVDVGTFEMTAEGLRLRWQRWEPEELLWSEELQLFASSDKSFTLRETPVE